MNMSSAAAAKPVQDFCTGSPADLHTSVNKIPCDHNVVNKSFGPQVQLFLADF